MTYFRLKNTLHCTFHWATLIVCGPGSSVCIATGYGLDGTGIESRWGRERVGSVIYEDWTHGSSPWNTSRNAWTRIKNVTGAIRLSNFWNFFFWRDPNDFLSWLVTADVTWFYHCDPETKQQPMEWRHTGSHRPITLIFRRLTATIVAVPHR
jgi:hypothetical protein